MYIYALLDYVLMVKKYIRIEIVILMSLLTVSTYIVQQKPRP